MDTKKLIEEVLLDLGNNKSLTDVSCKIQIIVRLLGDEKLKYYLPVQINSLILTGSIIGLDYDWNALIPNKVGRVLNMVAEGDDAVKFMPEGGWKKLVGMDPLFGQGAIDGVKDESENVVNRKIEILTHTNIFKDDMIEQVFLPYLNVNNGIAHREATQELVKRD